LCHYPVLLNDERTANLFPPDAIARARQFMSDNSSGLGAYSHSMGLPSIREEVAAFLAARDGHPASPENIFLTDGASTGIQRIMTLMIRNERDGIMTPIPQYPLYSASIALLGGRQVGYFLDEQHNWGLTVEELQRSLTQARNSGVNVRALVVINPNNPTGGILTEQNMRDIVDFCAKEHLVLLADEVYQENVYRPDARFISFKKVLRDMGPQYDGFELASFHSISKGFLGECGYRGGITELVGFDASVKAEAYKLASLGLCSNVAGQLMVSLMVNPPKPGDPSYALYVKERDNILASLKRRATKLVAALNKLEGFSCNEADGAMYTFPQVRLPEKAVAAAHAAHKQPDTFYCLQLLENTGICVVPGSGFGQVDGTYHFRTTFLPPEDEIDQVVERMAAFHSRFMLEYK